MSLRTRLHRPQSRAARFGSTLVAGVTGAAVLAAAVVGGVATAAPADAAGPAGVSVPTTGKVVSANDLIESVGVNIHSYYNDTSYADIDRVRSLLQGLGVRHVRDGLVPNRPDEVAALTKLGTAGIRSLLILGGTKNAATQSVDPAQLSALAQVRPYVDAVESTNEYDCSGDPAWAAHQRSYAQALVAALQSREDFRSLGVVAPSFCRPESVAQFGSATGLATVSNAHNYANGQAPELALESRLPAWAASQNASLPMAMTETGYHNALNAAFPSVGVTEQTAADYTVRSLLEAVRLGVSRTYLYELLDEKPEPNLRDPEQHYGLVRQDGTPKPAYTALRNLLSGVAQGSPAAVTPAAAATSDVVSVRGGGSRLRTLSITDPSGGGETLALWLTTPLEDATHTRLPDVARPVRVEVNGTHTATTRQPSRDNTESRVGTGTAFTVPVDGAVTLLHLTPTTQPATTAACTAQPGYATLAARLGALATSDLAPAGWSGAPAVATLPDGMGTGATISANGQQRRVAVAGAPTSWTIALWARTDAGTANFSTFARAVGPTGSPLAGGLLRTYDVTGDAPSHVQLSGYGTPVTGASYGNETFGQALGGEWHLVTLAVGAGRATVTVDGVVTGSVASGAAALGAVDVGSLGGAFRGALGGLAVFGRALDADEVGRLATTSAGSCELGAAEVAVPAADAVTPVRTPVTTTPDSTTPAVTPVAKPVVKPVAKAKTVTKAKAKKAEKKKAKKKKAKKAKKAAKKKPAKKKAAKK